MRQMSSLIAAVLVAAPVAWAPTAGEAAARKWHGARFHGAEVYLPGYAYAGPAAPPIFNDGGAYCWHWFRNGRGWATTWWC